MIHAFKELGKRELEGLSESEKKRKFLETQTIMPNQPDNDDKDAEKYREVIINLDIEKEEIEVKQGKELYKDNREDFFGFDLKSGNSSKTFFTSNKWYYHLLTIPHLIYYVEKDFNKNDYKEFLQYLKQIEEIFYITERKDVTNRPSNTYLNLNKFIPSQKEKLTEYIEKNLKKAQNKNKTQKINDLKKLKLGEQVDYKIMRKYLKKLISEILGVTQKFVSYDKHYLNIFSLKINNKYITETQYKDYYILSLIHISEPTRPY